MSAAVFARHLDLGPLRGRRRGTVRCLFHQPDRRGSLSVDLDRGVFNCFACGAQGGLKKFSELVGERSASPHPSRSPRRESDRDRAWRAVMEREHAAEARRAEWLPLWHVSDHIRRCAHAAHEARRWATALGPNDPRTGPLLERAAAVELEGLSVEAALDAILAEGRVA